MRQNLSIIKPLQLLDAILVPIKDHYNIKGHYTTVGYNLVESVLLENGWFARRKVQCICEMKDSVTSCSGPPLLHSFLYIHISTI